MMQEEHCKLVFGSCSAGILARKLAFMIESFCGVPQPLQANAGIIP
jgi:hypothetical protein